MLSLGVRKHHVIQIVENPLYGIRSQYALSVRSILSFDQIELDRTGPEGTAEFVVTGSQMTEVLPNVRVCCGKLADGGQDYAKLVIDAPKSIAIIRRGHPDEEYYKMIRKQEEHARLNQLP